MKVEKLGKTAKSFGLLGSNTKTITSPKPHLFEESVFSTGATADAAPSQQQPKTPLAPFLRPLFVEATGVLIVVHGTQPG